MRDSVFIQEAGRELTPNVAGAFRWTVPDGAGALDTLLFDDGTSRLVFSHTYRQREGIRDVRLLNDLRAVVDYDESGDVSGFCLTMHVVIPSRLGKEFVAGADVSAGAKTFFEFSYDKLGKMFVLREVTMGAATKVMLDEGALMNVARFPFPVPDRLNHNGGYYTLKYLASDGDVAGFVFPLRRPSRRREPTP